MTMKKIYSEPTLEMMQMLAASDDVQISDIEELNYGGTDTGGVLDPS